MEDSSTPFLTESQRAALDAALAAKARAKVAVDAGTKAVHANDVHTAKKHGAIHIKPVHGTAGDRKSKQTKGSGSAKKGGGGGKFTWGNALLNEGGDAAIDKNDPNYDSEADADVREVEVGAESEEEYEPVMNSRSKIVQQVTKYKSEIMIFLREYLESGDMVETARCIGELQLPQYDYYIVKRAVTLAMDRKEREKEAISVLLSNMYGQYISPQQMQKGFVSVLEGLDDLILDVPDAVEVMALFICRAITDEILPPSFIGRLTPPPKSPLEEMKHKCQLHLEQRHSAERLLRCWGVDAKLEFADARESIVTMLKEFVASKDIQEVERQLRSLNAPFFHHEVVKQTILMCTEDMAHQGELVGMLEQLVASAEISTFQVYKGFQRVVDQLEDLTLDNPALRPAFHAVYDACVARGIIEPGDQTALQESERRTSIDGARDAAGAAHVHTVAAFKKDALTTIQEYFSSTDVSEVVLRLTERDEPGMLHIFVKQLIQAAMERTYRERELASLLLVRLVPSIISREQLGMGLLRLLSACDDMVLDIPEAVHLLTLFLGRLIVDEILPPAFLHTSLDSLRNGGLAITVVRNTGTLLSSKHAAERLLNCWHGGLHTSEQLQKQMRLAVHEFLTTSEFPEVVRCLHDLAVPYYGHEFVRLVVEAIFEDPSRAPLLVRLLRGLADSGDINQTQMAKGVKKVQTAIDDYALDAPMAKTLLADLVKEGEAQKWLVLDADV